MRSNKPRGRLLLAIGAMMLSGSALAAADLVLNVSDDPDPGYARGIFNYQWRVNNNGPDLAENVEFVHTYPEGAVFVSVAPATDCVDNGATRTLTCQLGTMSFDASETRDVKVMLPTAKVWENTGEVTSTTQDSRPGNNKLTEPTTVKTAADIKLTATSSADNIVAGAAYDYQLVAKNLGPSDIENNKKIKVTFDVPPGSAITARPSGPGWSCEPEAASNYPLSIDPLPGDPLNPAKITCERDGPLVAGVEAPAITVPAVANTSGEIIFLASVKGFESNGTKELPEGNLENNESRVIVTTTNGSDVSIIKTQSPAGDAIVGGTEVKYTLIPRHEGGNAPGSTGDGKITVTDTLSSGLTYIAGSLEAGAGWSCEVVGQEITCERPGPWLGGTFTNMPAIKLKATATTVKDTDLSNTAVITIPENDPNLENNTFTVGTKVTNAADLEMSKTSSLSYPAMLGQEFNYRLRARNIGPLSIPAGDTITITDTLPVGISLEGIEPPAGWTCTSSPNDLPATNATVECSSTQGLSVGSWTPFTNLRVKALTAGEISNEACVALDSGTVEDKNPSNNCSVIKTIGTQDGQHADVSIVKTADKTTLKAGELLTYTLTVSNAGPALASKVEVRDVMNNLLPGNTGGIRTINAPSGTACTPNAPSTGPNRTLVCTIPSLAVGATQDITVTVVPNVAGSVEITRPNTATAYSLEVADKNRTNNTSKVDTTVTPLVDLTVTKVAEPNPVHAGGPLTYAVTVKNNGPSTATGIKFIDTLPVLAGFIDTYEGTSTCTSQPAVGELGGQLECGVPDLAVGEQKVLTYRIRPTIDAVGTDLINTVVVSTTTEESDLENNEAKTTTPVIAPKLDILVNKTDTPDPVDLGELVTYTIRMENIGPSAGSQLTMVDTFPVNGTDENPIDPTAIFSYQGNLKIDGVDVSQVDGVTCTAPAIDATAGVIECKWDENDAFDADAPRSITYQMRAEVILNDELTGTSYNKVSVAVTETEEEYANNQVTEPTSTRRKEIATDLEGTKTASPKALLPGEEVVFTLTVKNLGPEASSGAQIADPLPDGLTFVSASASCHEDAGRVTCAIGELAVGESVSFEITAKVDDDFTGRNL